jgi:hypothetical protein
MIEDRFDARTVANMSVALERVCQQRHDGEDHKFGSASRNGLFSVLNPVRELWLHLRKPANSHSGR